MSDTPDHDDERVLAGEYALGLMEPEEAQAFAVRLKQEPALAALVAGWHENLAGLTDEIDPVAPPAAVKQALDARLFGGRTSAPKLGWMRRVLGGLALVAALFVGVLFFSPDDSADMLAEIAADDASFVLVASYFEEEGYLQLERRTGEAREGRSLELWLIEGDNPPVSLGVMAQTSRSILTVPEEFRAKLAGAVLAVSDEPSGGSPTGAPTGDVLATGLVSGV
ncbi:anti-sigma factor domain-containing protein [Lentibacter sp. XHP0401]|uniref:anti-sigma factor n=1 Tax=Lentibacter sp. XHP0401 TaxID=2984334 RepID=UPI0021E96275|nr:anti-sigma factor [Lentibacter sp. XHP0401]MCV2891652.1 anti-sigma factor [Lentibacter sp. XHP0401]